MTAMTRTALPVDAWTPVYTAAGAVTITMQNQSPGGDLWIRIDAAAVVGDALTAASDILRYGEHRLVTLATGDKVFAQPMSDQNGPGLINIRA